MLGGHDSKAKLIILQLVLVIVSMISCPNTPKTFANDPHLDCRPQHHRRPQPICHPERSEGLASRCLHRYLHSTQSPNPHPNCHPERSEATAERSRRTPHLPAVQQAQQGISTTNSSHAGHFVHSGEQSPRVVAPTFRLDEAFNIADRGSGKTEPHQARRKPV